MNTKRKPKPSELSAEYADIVMLKADFARWVNERQREAKEVHGENRYRLKVRIHMDGQEGEPLEILYRDFVILSQAADNDLKNKANSLNRRAAKAWKEIGGK